MYLAAGILAGLLLYMLFAALFVRRDSTFPTQALEAADRGGDYLARHTNDDGQFDYRYDAKDDEVLSGYNMVRHAGTTYAMFELYQETKVSPLLDAALRANQYMLERFGPCPAPLQAQHCLYDGEKVKLGGHALAVLALVQAAEVTGDNTYIKEAEGLARWMLSLQTDSGEFVPHIVFQNGVWDDHVSGYYPGEAIFALVRLYKATGKEAYLSAAQQAALWLIEVRDADKTALDITHDHWLLYGLNELHEIEADSRYEAHVRTIVDSIVALQHRGLVNFMWNGGYYSPPRSTPTATRSEGLAAAYELFVRTGDTAYTEKCFDSLERGIAFQLRTHIDLARAREYKNRVAALGGFTNTPSDSEVRIDYVQHNISALLAYARIAEEAQQVQ